MNMLGHPPKLTVVPEPELDTYLVMFFNGGSVEVACSYMEWGSAFVKFYEEVTPTNHVLKHAFNVTTVEEIREVVDA